MDFSKTDSVTENDAEGFFKFFVLFATHIFSRHLHVFHFLQILAFPSLISISMTMLPNLSSITSRDSLMSSLYWEPDIKTAEEFLVPANNAKNRYVNIPLSKTSRVVLKGEGPVDTYIHANYIPGTDSNEDYIVTQSPLPETVKDFWSMVYHEGVTNIVMVCSFSTFYGSSVYIYEHPMEV